ncbi:MAG: glycosyltransferase family 2 protein [Pseudomonadota bacterium]
MSSVSTEPVEVSILVVSYNTRDMTLDCLRSVVRETKAPHEIIVVDNASSDGSAEAIAEAFPDLQLIASKENLGFGQANNLGAQRAKARLILLLNPDTVILDGAIDTLLDLSKRTPQAKMWGGRTVFADGSPNRTNCYQDLTLWRLFCRAVGLSAATHNHPYFSTMYGEKDMAYEREVAIVTGCFLLLTQDLWNSLRGFDPDFFLFDEETDLCLRARHQFGARPRYTPESVIIHHVGASMPSQAERIVRQLKGRQLLIQKHFNGVRQVFARALVAAMPATRALAERITGQRDGKWSETWRRRKDWLA